MQISFILNDFFSSNNDSFRRDVETPTFLVKNGVVGRLKIKDLDEALLEDDCARIEIDLEGFMRTQTYASTQCQSRTQSIVEKKILSMTQAISIWGHRRGTCEDDQHYPFNFDVLSCLRREQGQSTYHKTSATKTDYASIPPSLRHEAMSIPQGAPKPRAGARVSFKLTARLLKDQQVVGRYVQPILLLHSQPPGPPMCTTDFAGEYRMKSKSAVRGSLLQRVGAISAVVEEPKRLAIRPGCVNAMVELPIKLRLDSSRQDLMIGNQLVVQAEIKWHVRVLTFVSTAEQQGPATLKQTLASPSTTCVRSCLPSRTLNMAWRSWQSTKNDGRSFVVEDEQVLRLAVPRSEILTPTFWSPFLSRRYTIHLQVKFSKPGSAKLEIEVPIQVGIEDVVTTELKELPDLDMDGGQYLISDGAEVDELLPQYPCK